MFTWIIFFLLLNEPSAVRDIERATPSEVLRRRKRRRESDVKTATRSATEGRGREGLLTRIRRAIAKALRTRAARNRARS